MRDGMLHSTGYRHVSICSVKFFLRSLIRWVSLFYRATFLVLLLVVLRNACHVLLILS